MRGKLGLWTLKGSHHDTFLFVAVLDSIHSFHLCNDSFENFLHVLKRDEKIIRILDNSSFPEAQKKIPDFLSPKFLGRQPSFLLLDVCLVHV